MPGRWHREGFYTGPLDFWGDVPREFRRAERVRDIYPGEQRPPGLSMELAEAMARDFGQYPSLRTLAAAYRLDYETVEGWILKGISGECSELERHFSVQMAAAEAEAARSAYQRFLSTALLGGKSAVDHYKLLTERWHHVLKDPDISTIVQKKSDKGERRKNLLRNPPPALVAELKAAGWVRRGK